MNLIELFQQLSVIDTKTLVTIGFVILPVAILGVVFEHKRG